MNTDGKSLDCFWNLSAELALERLACNPEGLSAAEAKQRLKSYGPNMFRSKPRRSLLMLFFSQFKSPVTLLLIVAALLSAGLGDVADTTIILTIVLT